MYEMGTCVPGFPSGPSAPTEPRKPCKNSKLNVIDSIKREPNKSWLSLLKCNFPTTIPGTPGGPCWPARPWAYRHNASDCDQMIQENLHVVYS